MQLRRWNKAICPRTITMLEPLIQVSSNSKSSSPAKRCLMHGRSPRITLWAPKTLALLILPFKMFLLSSREKTAIGNWIVTFQSNEDTWSELRAHLHKVAIITLAVISFYSRKVDLHAIWVKRWEVASLRVTQCLFCCQIRRTIIEFSAYRDLNLLLLRRHATGQVQCIPRRCIANISRIATRFMLLCFI